MKYAIAIVERISALAKPSLYVKTYDPDALDGRGFYTDTTDPKHAMLFDSFEDAIKTWRRQSTVRPLREDGKPNRPLTALTIEIVKI